MAANNSAFERISAKKAVENHRKTESEKQQQQKEKDPASRNEYDD